MDWDTAVTDHLVLRSLRGAVDYLAEELRDVSGGARINVLRRHHDRLDVELSGPLSALRGLHFYSECAVDLGVLTDAGDLSAGPLADRLRHSLSSGALSAMDGAPELRFRVGDLGDARWQVRDRLTDAWGWVNSPRHWQVNLDLVEGRLLVTLGDLHLTRRQGRLERLPASTTPVLAAALVRLAKIPDGVSLLDPFCGAGTNLLLAHAMAAPGLILGSDLRADAVRQARQNASYRTAPLHVVRADAVRQPWPDASVQRVIANLPFGKRVGSHGANRTLYPGFLRELDRVLTGDGRAVLLTEDKRLLVDTVQRTRGLRIVKEATFGSGGGHPTAYVVVRSRGQARRRSRRPIAP
ncbi:MAG TPA: methyltransferase domain-containing protein [Nocardioides sp.]|uniref:TRM11 family SAM-dependent methyltransferase n=1 Tax=Nocardioides sp. TaxID=35761 RepID=UPI002F4150E2